MAVEIKYVEPIERPVVYVRAPCVVSGEKMYVEAIPHDGYKTSGVHLIIRDNRDITDAETTSIILSPADSVAFFEACLKLAQQRLEV